MENNLIQQETIIDKKTYRNGMAKIEAIIKAQPDSMTGDCFPLVHKFADGCYIREIHMPKGSLLTSKIHKKCHPYFILKGEVSVLTDKGVERLKAPFSGITMPGTKRLLYIHEDTVWTTIHVTNETELEKIEEEIIAKTFDEIDFNERDIECFICETEKQTINNGGTI